MVKIEDSEADYQGLNLDINYLYGLRQITSPLPQFSSTKKMTRTNFTDFYEELIGIAYRSCWAVYAQYLYQYYPGHQ